MLFLFRLSLKIIFFAVSSVFDRAIPAIQIQIFFFFGGGVIFLLYSFHRSKSEICQDASFSFLFVFGLKLASTFIELLTLFQLLPP